MTEKQNWFSKISKLAKSCKRGLAIFLLLAGAGVIARAATVSWPFNSASEVVLSDSSRVEISGGAIQLKLQKPWYKHDTRPEFAAGTFSDTDTADTNFPSASTPISLSSSGLVAYWSFNGNLGSISNNATANLDDSKGDNEGTASNANGTGMSFVAGKFGNALSMDGVDDKVVVGNLSEASGGDFTMSLWVKFTTVPGTGSSAAFIRRDAAGGTSLEMSWANGDTDEVRIQLNDNSAITQTKAMAVTAGTWYHIAMTYDQANSCIYIDGSGSCKANAKGTASIMGSHPMAFGGTGGGFHGAIDDAAIWSRALSRDEIEAIAASGSAVRIKPTASVTKHAPKLSGNYPGIVAYWPFDNSSGLTTPDLAGRFKGTLLSMETPTDWVSGINGNALDFDGIDEHISIGSGIDFSKYTTGWTISGWVRPDTTPGAGQQQVFFIEGSGTGATQWQVILAYDDANKFRISRERNPTSSVTLISTNAYAVANWYHVAARWDGTNLKLYVNGTEDGSTAATNTTGSAGTSFIGSVGGASFFNGLIDEFAIFSRSLSAGEIAYLAGKKGETATYTSPVMDGEITTATWDKITASYANVTPGMQFVSTSTSTSANIGLSTGDLDGDGDVDFVSGKTAANNVLWYKNDGSGIFTSTSLGSAIGVSASAIADLTGDKANDIVVADGTNNLVSWFKNDGAAVPTFTLQSTFATDASALTAATGDIDNDGDIDIVVGYGGAVDKIVWYQSDGASTPTFTAQTAVATSFDATFVLVKDLNADGFLDIAAASFTDSKLVWYKGNGGASWTATNINTTASSGWNYVGAGDIDKDGDIDLTSAGKTNTTFAWFVNDGSATPTFSTRNNLSTSTTEAGSILPVDYDNDGDMDLLSSTQWHGSGSNKVEWWKNDGAQNFGAAIPIATSMGGIFSSLAVPDIDGDGDLDLLLATSNDWLWVYNNAPWKNTSIAGPPYTSDAVDINNDGVLDLVGRDSTNTRVGYTLSTSPGVFSGSSFHIDAAFTASSAAAADLNQDGKIDLAAYGTSGLAYWAQGADVTTWTQTVIDGALTAGGGVVKLADLDGDGRTDMLAAGDGKIRWWKQNTSTPGQFDAQTDIDGSVAVTTDTKIADMDGDGLLDVISAHKNPTNLTYWYRQTSAGVFAAKSAAGAGGFDGDVLPVDLNGDGKLDIYNCRVTKYELQTSSSPLTFAAAVTITTGSNITTSAAVADIDGDGDLDIVGTGSNSTDLRILKNVGTLTSPQFVGSIIHKTNNSPGVPLIADFNQDGMLDIAASYTNGRFYTEQISHANILLQARTDTTSSPATNFVGPTNDAKSYFSSGAGIISNLDAKRYFQWQASLYRNDTSLDPMVRNVKVEYTAKNYSTLTPYVESAIGQTFTYLTGFTRSGENTPGTSGIRYILSADGGNTWKYYNSGWVTSDGSYAQASTPAILNTNIGTFDDTMTANGTVKWRAIFSSGGDDQPSVGGINIDYEIASLSLVKPVGGERWGRNTSQLIEWTPTGTVPNDLTLEYNAVGSSSVFDQPITSNVNSTHHNEELMSGAVAVYHFGTDTSSAIADTATTGLTDSKGTNHGTASNANGTGMTFTAGKFGAGVNFDGVDDSISLGNGVNQTAAMTASAWVNLNSLAATNRILVNGTGGANSNYFFHINTAGKLGVSWVNTGIVTGATTLSTGAWYHVAVTRSGSSGNWTVNLYVNGVLDGTTTTAVNPDGSSLPTTMGTGPFGSPTWFNGKIDEVAIFNRALAADEIAALAKTNPGYVWKVPNIVSTQMRLRVRSVAAPAIRSSSTSDFKTGIVWTNGGGNGLWSNAANWDAGVVPQAGDSVIFNGTSTANVTGDTINDNLGSIILDSTYTGTVTIKKNSVSGGMTLNVVNDVTVNSGNLVLEADADGTPVNGSGFTINAKDITVANGATLNADGQGFAPGAGPGAGTATQGASHGGVGGVTTANGTPKATYGSATNPTSIGSGAALTSSGGGAIILSASGTITVNGTLSADGQSSAGAGGGAGGTVNITAGTLTGTGTISAKGGASTTARGGGGRISVAGVTTFSFTGTMSAAGTPGTVGGPFRSYSGTINFPANFSLTVPVSKTWDIGSDCSNTYNFGTGTLTVNGTLNVDGCPTMNSGYGGAAKISAANITIANGGLLSADSLGFATGGTSLAGSGPGGGAFDATNGYGAGYGGVGNGSGGGVTYGSAVNPIYLGSGGGGVGNAGNGGGALILSATNTVTVTGTISANGGSGAGGGGGSGGSIHITGGTITGAGTIRANGGGATTASRHAGGGRIFLVPGTDSFSGTLTANAGGAGAGAGTTIRGKIWKGGSVSWNTAANWTNGTLPVAGDSVVFTGTVSNTSCNGSTVANNLANIIIASDYTGNVTLAQGAVGGGSALTLTGDLLMYGGTLTLAADKDGTPVNGSGFTINATNILVDTGAVLTANNQGFIAGSGPGAGSTTKGASHGGIGFAPALDAASTYGSAIGPTSVGSGAFDGGGGGAGGGAIKLVATGTTTVNGSISANGDTANTTHDDGASGGSIWITGGTLAGTGTISAKGGNTSGSGGNPGGGGRMDLSGTNITFTGTLSVAGGTNGTYMGGAGTIAFPSNYDLVLATDTTGLKDFALGYDGSYNYTFNSITVKNGSTLTLGSHWQDVNAAAGGVSGNPYGAAAKISAANITVQTGGKISADGQGFQASKGPGVSSTGNGASYGGTGSGNTPGLIYGNAVQPTALGSGSVFFDTSGIRGGGALALFASGTLQVDGTVSANGGASVNNREGASGGSVWVRAGTLAGAGSINAKGTNGLGATNLGGGGGRIYLALGTNNWAGTALTPAASATAGTGGTPAAANGTVTIASLDITSPDGGEFWKANKPHLISWTSGATLPNDLTLEYSTAGSDFTSATSIATNVAGNHHNEEKMTGALGVWHFDQGQPLLSSIPASATAGFQDSKGTNHGTSSNANGTGFSFTGSGKFGNAVTLDGVDDFIDIPHAAAFNAASMTFSAWFKTSDGSGDIVTKYVNGSNNGYMLGILSNKLYGYYAASAGNRVDISSAANVNDNVWHHGAYVVTPTSGTLYLDGVQVAQSAWTGTAGTTSTAASINIGARNNPANPLAGTVDEVAIFNRALAPEEVAALASSNPGYIWTAPVLDTNTVRVRVRSAADTVLSSMSAANFTITDLNVTAPNGAEIWKVGQNYNVTWSGGANLSNDIILEYTTAAFDPLTTGTDPFTTWVPIDNTDVAPKNAIPATHSWLAVPDSVSSTARVRVRSQSKSDLVDVSNANFTIADLNLTNPNGTNILYEGEKYQITWGHGGTNLADVVLTFDTGMGYVSLNPAATNLSVRRSDTSTSSIAGFDPASISNAAGVWRLNEGAGTAVYDSVNNSNATLTIGAGGSNATAANAWVNGQFGKALSFDGTDDYAHLGTSVGQQGAMTFSVWFKPTSLSSYQVIAANTETWVSPSNYYLAMHTTGKLRFLWRNTDVIANSNGALSAGNWYHLAFVRSGSSGNWTAKIYINGILDTQGTTTANPNSGASARTLIGASYGLGSTYAEFSSGTFDEAAVYSRALSDAEIRKLAGGSYEWTVPDTPSTTTRILVRSPSTVNLSDVSDANFEIRARSVVLNSPNGSESWQEASRQTIQWTTAGLMSNNLTLDYNKGGGAYTTIATGVDAGGKPFESAVGAWGFGEGSGQTVADKSGKGNNATLGSTTSAEISDPVFVRGKFGYALDFDGVDDKADVADNASLDFGATDSFSIAFWFNSTGNLNGAPTIMAKNSNGSPGYDFVPSGTAVRFRIDDNTFFPQITSGAGVIDGNWHHVVGIRDAATDQLKLYIDGAAVTPVTDSTTSTLANSLPLSFGSFNSCCFGKAKLDEVQIYNRVLTSAEIAMLASGRANFPWTVPDDEHAQVKVRVTDANRAASTDNSDANFAITPRTVAVNAPNGAETWPYNSIQYIKWDATGPLSNNLTIKYDPDTTGGAVFPTTVASGVDAGGMLLSGGVGGWGLGAGSGTSVTDKSGNSNTGTLNLGTLGNTVTADAWKVGKLGYGIQFDGIDDYVDAGTNATLKPTGAVSLAAWVNWRDLTGDQLIAGAHNSNTGGYALWKQGGAMKAVIGDGTADYANGLQFPEASLSTGTWVHVAMTFNGSIGRIYLNGVEQDTHSKTTTISYTSVPSFKIGTRHGANASFFAGMIDEVQVYDRALTAAEVAVLAQGRGVYPWTVPDVGFSAGTRSYPNSQIRITDASRTATTDDSNANFNVRTPIIGTITPPAPAAVPFGTSQDISWANNWTGTPAAENQGGPVSSDIKLEYSIDDGSTWPGGGQLIVGGSLANGGPVTAPFNWGVTSGAVSNTVKIRVQDNTFPFAEGISNTFKVTGSIAVIKPNTAEKWAVGFPHTVSWLRNGDITNVKIFTHNGNGTPITTISNSTPAGNGSLSWTPLPGDAGTGLYIRVQDAADADVYDDSNVAFTVSRIQVSNQAARSLANNNITTTWTYVGVNNVKLEYSTDGTNFSTVSGASSLPAANGTHNWLVPQRTTTNFVVRAVDADVPGVGDTDLAIDASDSNTIIYGGLQVLVPSTTGITWASGQTQTITWSTSPANVNVVPNVRILAAKDGNFNNSSGGNIVTVVSSAPNHNNPGAGTGAYNWVPNFTSTLVKLRVLDPADTDAVAGTAPQGQGLDDSNNFFTISGISLTSPSGGETALVNGSFGITFGFTGVITNVDLHYSVNGGTTWTPIITNFNVPTNPYTYNWTPVPNAISSNVKVRVRDVSNPSTIFAESPAFNIKGSISVTTPPTLYVGDAYTIQYTTTGTVPNTRIEFSPSGNFSGDEIVLGTQTGLSGAQTPTAQTFNWPSNVPNTIGTTGKIRVVATDLSDTQVYPNGAAAMSGTSGAFSIAPKITITSPLGTYEWGVNDSNRNVTWTTTGTVTNVKIEYLDENDNYLAVKNITNSTANDGTHTWNPIPDIVSNAGQNPQVDRDILVKVRITDIDAGHPVTVVESAAFKVKWYRVLWKVKDADSGAFLQNLSVIDSQPWTVNDFSLTQTSGVFRNYKKGNYTTTWQKSSGYGDATIDNWVPDDANPDNTNGADMVREAFLQNDATANVPKQVKVEYNYDVATKTIAFRWWIEIKGKLETSANLLTAGRIEIINPADNTILQTVNDASEDANGLYDGAWAAGNSMDTTKLYFAKAVVTHNSQEFTSGITIDIRDTAAIQDLGTSVTGLVGQVGNVQTTADQIDTKVGTTTDTAASNTLFGKVANVKDTVGSVSDAAGANTVFGKLADGVAKVTTILDEVQNKIPAKIDEIDKEAANKGGRGQILKGNTKFAIGQTASIRFQHDIGKAPTCDIYGPDNTLIVSGQVMTDVSGKGIYDYDFKLLTTYKKGDYTVIVTEPDSGFMDSMVLTVLPGGSSDEDIASAITSASSFSQNASQDAKKAYEQLLALKESFGSDDEGGMGARLTQIQDVIGQMKSSLNVLTGETSEGGKIATVTEVHDSVLDVMKEIKRMASQKGVNLDSVYKTVESQGETTIQIQNMVSAVEAATRTTQEIIEKAQDKPVMTTWFEG